MPTLGDQLKEAREARGATPSEAAAATRIKVQHIQAMEKSDFSGIAAPAYAKGFIRLYADFLDLDPAPLLQEYEQSCMTGAQASLLPQEKTKKPAETSPPRKIRVGWKEAWSRATQVVRVGRTGRLAGLAALLIVGVFLGLSQCPRAADRAEQDLRTPSLPASAGLERDLLRRPPEPYLPLSVAPR